MINSNCRRNGETRKPNRRKWHNALHWEGNLKLPFRGNAFSKIWKQKKRPVNSQWAKRDFALQTGPITWTLGAKGVVLLLRLWLWISKIKEQKERKKRKCDKTGAPQEDKNSTICSEYTHLSHSDWNLTFSLHICSWLIKDYLSLSLPVRSKELTISLFLPWTFSPLLHCLRHSDVKPSCSLTPEISYWQFFTVQNYSSVISTFLGYQGQYLKKVKVCRLQAMFFNNEVKLKFNHNLLNININVMFLPSCSMLFPMWILNLRGDLSLACSPLPICPRRVFILDYGQHTQ